MKRRCTLAVGLLVAMHIVCFAGTGLAGIPEPDVIYYGTAEYEGSIPQVITLVTVSLKFETEVLASYTMDPDNPLNPNNPYEGKYALRIPMDAMDPIEGETAIFYVDGVPAGKAVIPAKGSVVQLDLDTLAEDDNDEDDMRDSWELAYFGTLDRDGSGDINGDGITDLEEFQNKTIPTAADWQNGEVCVFHPLELQNALTDAGQDDIDNVIRLQTGIYTGTFTYSAAWGEDYDLEIIGGFGDDCNAVDISGELSELNGNAEGTVLSLDTAAGPATGGIQVSNLFVTNGDAAEGGGIAVFSDIGDVSLFNNVIAGNVATQAGGGLSLRVQGDGAAVLVANNTIDNNEGGGIYCNSSKIAAEITNNIITNSIDGEGIRAEGIAPVSDFNTLFNNGGGAYSNPDYQGSSDIFTDPLFLDAAGKDYSLQTGSLSIDAGRNDSRLPETDFHGAVRITDGNSDGIYRMDAGAYESAGSVSTCDFAQLETDQDCDTVPDASDTCPGFDDINAADSDDDGVPDECDRCPNIEGEEDLDGDGMSDCWESFYGVDDPGADDDGDDISNLREYLAGTHPKDANSAPENLPPTIPKLVEPAHQSEVSETWPMLKVENAIDDDMTPPTYDFELYALIADEFVLQTSADNEDEGGEGITSWTVDVGLVDNTFCRWRVRARDDSTSASPWSSFFTFFVNMDNDAPLAPSLNSPPDGDEVPTRVPALVVDNAVDPDRDELTYFFEIDPAETFDSGPNGQPLIKSNPEEITAETDDTTTWTPPVLDDNSVYFWRARACDEDQECSGWMTPAGFFVNASNDAPSVPNISLPPDGSQVQTLQPTLEVTNAADADGDPLTYEFELYARSEDLTYLLVTAGGPVAEGDDGATSWQVDQGLEKNRTYWWRARAKDDEGLAGDWTEPMYSFAVVTANAAPDAPSIITPQDGAAVQSLMPSLLVFNSYDKDQDAVSYYFDIDKVNTFDSTALQRSGRLPEGIGGLTAWHPSLPLIDRTTYYWRVMAFDGSAYSKEWTHGSFVVNLANDPPTEPVVVSPQDGSEVPSLTPSLVIHNVEDPNQDAVSYYFEIDKVGAFDSTDLQQSPRLPQGAGNTTAWRPSALTDNSTFYWRVIAYDGASYSGWTTTATLFVNLANDPPEAPTLKGPAEGSHVANVNPVIQVNDATDVDGDEVTYDYEVYADSQGDSLVRSIQGAGPSWKIDANLDENRFYWWRFRARDESGQTSVWSDLLVFFVNTVNDAPSAPSINRPQYGQTVDTLLPVLEVNNGADVDDTALTYEFEIDTVSTFSSPANQFEAIPQGNAHTTSWSPWDLADHTTYYWRARACDDESCSRWMTTATFFVNTINETPVIPNLSSPPDGSEVTTTRPTLEVTNATNPDQDRLTYEFEVYRDSSKHGLVIQKTGVLEEADGTTSWRVFYYLKRYHTYWWRVQARDAHGEASGWSALFSFKVDTHNQAPEPPAIVSPVDDGEVATPEPVLEVENAVDSSWDTLTYWFEIDKVNTFDSLALQQSPEIEEGAGQTTAWCTSTLEENTAYNWRARAYDGEAYGDWRIGSFFVNPENDPPYPPTIQNPDDASALTGMTVILSVYPDTDADLDELTYDYELYDQPDLASGDRVTSITDAADAWTVDVSLADQDPYYWRTRAVDETGLQSEWTAAVAFSVNTQNARPAAPILNNPFNRGVVTALTPTLSVNNAMDPDDAQLTYEFELYADPGLTEPVSAARLPGGHLITAWTVDTQLADKTTYYWRARANDGQLPGSWMNTSTFVVDTEGPETRVVLACAQDVSAAAETTQIVEVTRKGSPLYGVSLEIPTGALQKDCTITIGMVENPPALPANIKAIGGVLDFGPDGSHFDVPLTVRIPYTWQDLQQAGVSDPAELEVMTFNPVTLAWETIPVDRVEGWDLIYLVDHFSIYATGKSLSSIAAGDEDPGTDPPPDASTAAGSDGGGGGACFISSTAKAGSMGLDHGFVLVLVISILWICLGRSRKASPTKTP